MPTNEIRKDAREGKGTVKSLEKKWDKAKDAAGNGGHKGKGQDWALTNYIYNKEKKAASLAKALDDLQEVESSSGATTADPDNPQAYDSMEFETGASIDSDDVDNDGNFVMAAAERLVITAAAENQKQRTRTTNNT